MVKVGGKERKGLGKGRRKQIGNKTLQIGVKKRAPLEENFQIVPWSCSDEWNEVCGNFLQKDYKRVIETIGIWENRVPVLPVGVESTLLVLEALCYDEKRHDGSSDYSENHARSLYSLALVRYLNHVGHFAAHSIGEKSTLPTKDLASQVGTPDWLVTLRNEVSHGATTPTTEILRVAGDFIVEWLKGKYWKSTNSNASGPHAAADERNDCFTTDTESQEALSLTMSEVLSAFVAARIYKLRGIHFVEDMDILKYLPGQPVKAKIKTVMVNLRKKLADYLNNNPSMFCPVIAQEMTPNMDFYKEFENLFSTEDPFEKLVLVWNPVMKLLERKNKVFTICNYLAELHVSSDSDGDRQKISAEWIDMLLKKLEESGKQYGHKLDNLLKAVIMQPNLHTKIFLKRLLQMLKHRIGVDKARKLETLVSIWAGGSTTSRPSASASKLGLRNGELFTIKDLSLQCNLDKPYSSSGGGPEDVKENWTVDSRDSRFWGGIPMGALVQ